jgi:hypothetical protein
MPWTPDRLPGCLPRSSGWSGAPRLFSGLRGSTRTRARFAGRPSKFAAAGTPKGHTSGRLAIPTMAPMCCPTSCACVPTTTCALTSAPSGSTTTYASSMASGSRSAVVSEPFPAMRSISPTSATTGSFGRADTRLPASRLGCSAASWSEVAVYRGPADAKGLGNLGQGVLPRAVHLLSHLGLVGGHHRRSATMAPAGSGCGQPGGGAFADEVAFELGQGREHVEDELAARGRGVDRLLETAEPDAALGQASDGVDQMAQRAAEPVEFQTTRVSPGRSWSRTCSRTGRSLRAPLAVSVNTR